MGNDTHTHTSYPVVHLKREILRNLPAYLRQSMELSLVHARTLEPRNAKNAVIKLTEIIPQNRISP